MKIMYQKRKFKNQKEVIKKTVYENNHPKTERNDQFMEIIYQKQNIVVKKKKNNFSFFLNIKETNHKTIYTENNVKQTFLNISWGRFLNKIEKFFVLLNLRENFLKLIKYLHFLNKCTAKNFKNGGYWCFVYTDKLCEVMHLKQTRVKEMLKTLEEIGLITRVSVYNPKTRRYQRRIFLNYLCVEDLDNIKIIPEEMHKIETNLCGNGCQEKAEEEKFFSQENGFAQPEDSLYIDAGASGGDLDQTYINTGLEASTKTPNTIKINTLKKNNKYITIATTNLKLSNKGKNAQRKNEEVVVAENDLFSSEPFKGEETEKEIFENNKELDTENRKKLDIQNDYDFEKLEEKDAQKNDLENEIEADVLSCQQNCIRKICRKSNYTKYKILSNSEKTTNISSTISTKIKKLKDEFLELGKLYYENQTFLGELRTIMAKDYRKAREQYMRLCLVGKANKDAVLYEIRQYLHWLELNRSKRKQKLFSFMISPYRDWEDAKERAALEKKSCEEDIDIAKKIILLDPFDTPEEKAQALKRLEGGDDFSEENCDTSYASTEVVDEMKKKSLPKKQLEEEFDKAWELYPRKKGKEKARKYFERDRNDGVDFEKILHGVKCYAAEVENDGIEEEFTKHGSTWFNGKYWADYEGLPEPKSKSQIEKEKSENKEAKKSTVKYCTPEQLRENEEMDYELALESKERWGGWATSYLKVMPEWVREKEGITEEQLHDWIEHPINPF